MLPNPYRSPAFEERLPPRKPWLHRIGQTVLVVVAVAMGLGYWIWLQGAQARAVAALPAAERAQLLVRTLADLRLCHAEAREDALREFCEKQAALARAIPECRADCRALALLPWAGPRRR